MRSDRKGIARKQDVEWVERVRAGDELAFAEIHAAYSARIRAFIYKRIRDAAEAEDLTQETFLQLYRAIASYDGRASLLTWAFGIAQNVCLHYFRHCSRWMVGPWKARELEGDTTDAEIERSIDAARLLARCDAALAAERRPAHQAIFRLRHADRLSIRSIANQVGTTSQAVKVSLQLSRKLLVAKVPDLVVLPIRSTGGTREGSILRQGATVRGA